MDPDRKTASSVPFFARFLERDDTPADPLGRTQKSKDDVAVRPRRTS
jgi:hypothetical protein